MFIRYVANTKKIKTSTCTVDEGYDYEVNCNGIHFIYDIDVSVGRTSYKITQITFIRDVTICIRLFTSEPPSVWVNNKTRTMAYVEYYMCNMGGKYDYISTRRYSQGMMFQLVGAHHDLLRSLRAIDPI